MTQESTQVGRFDIQEAVNAILREKRSPFKADAKRAKSFHAARSFETSPTRYWTGSLTERQRLVKVRLYSSRANLTFDFPAIRERVEALERQMATVNVAKINTVHELCKVYIDKVKSVQIAVEVLLSQEEDVAMIWTIIDAPPFEDMLREPIYAAQLDVLRSSGDDIDIDFHILNLSEISDSSALKDIIPPDAEVVWQR